jgi:hypothetical protein
MKKNIIATLILTAALSNAVFASTSEEDRARKVYSEAIIEQCDSDREVAYMIMKTRQMNLFTPSEHIQTIKDVHLSSDSEKRAIELVRETYNTKLEPARYTETIAKGFGYEKQVKCLNKYLGKAL